MAEQVHKIADLIPDPENARKHTPRNIGMIRDALGQVGAARSIVIDENNVVLAGNGVLEAAADAGIEKVQVVDADGETIIAVRRSNLTPEQKKKLALFDNRTAELAMWDAAQIAADMEAGLDLTGMFYDNELAAILEQAADGILATPYTDQFDQENAELDGAEDVTIQVVVPAMHAETVTGWLANGESKTGPGIGRGVLKRCGLL